MTRPPLPEGEVESARKRRPGEGYAGAGGARLCLLSRGRFPSPLPLSLRERGSRRDRRTRYFSPRNLSFGSVTFFGLLASALA
jgi:hypothetical protein